MKYFKVANINDPEEEFYVSSTLANETPAHLATALCLAPVDGYRVVEVSQEEFECETEDDEDSD